MSKTGFSTLNRWLGRKNKDKTMANGKLSKSSINLSISSTNINETSQLEYNRITPLPAATTNAPFEQTFRITVLLPKDQLYVTRLGARVPLSKLLELVCDNKLLDREKYEFRNPVDPSQVYSCDLTIGAVGLSEIRLCHKTESYDSFSSDEILKLQRTTLIRESLSSSEFSSRNSKHTPKTTSPYSSTNSLNSMDSTALSYGRSNKPKMSAPPRKKRAAPRPPSQTVIPEKSPLIMENGHEEEQFKDANETSLATKDFSVSTPNLSSSTLLLSDINGNDCHGHLEDFNEVSSGNGSLNSHGYAEDTVLYAQVQKKNALNLNTQSKQDAQELNNKFPEPSPRKRIVQLKKKSIAPPAPPPRNSLHQEDSISIASTNVSTTSTPTTPVDKSLESFVDQEDAEDAASKNPPTPVPRLTTTSTLLNATNIAQDLKNLESSSEATKAKPSVNVSKVMLNRTPTPEPRSLSCEPPEIEQCYETQLEHFKQQNKEDDCVSKQADSGIGEPVPSPIPDSLTSTVSTLDVKSNFESSSDDDDMVKVYNFKLCKTLVKPVNETTTLEELAIMNNSQQEETDIEITPQVPTPNTLTETSSWNFAIPISPPPNFADQKFMEDTEVEAKTDKPITPKIVERPLLDFEEFKREQEQQLSQNIKEKTLKTPITPLDNIVDELSCILQEKGLDSLIKKSEDPQEIEAAKPNTLSNFTINSIQKSNTVKPKEVLNESSETDFTKPKQVSNDSSARDFVKAKEVLENNPSLTKTESSATNYAKPKEDLNKSSATNFAKPKEVLNESSVTDFAKPKDVPREKSSLINIKSSEADLAKPKEVSETDFTESQKNFNESSPTDFAKPKEVSEKNSSLSKTESSATDFAKSKEVLREEPSSTNIESSAINCAKLKEALKEKPNLFNNESTLMVSTEPENPILFKNTNSLTVATEKRYNETEFVKPSSPLSSPYSSNDEEKLYRKRSSVSSLKQRRSITRSDSFHTTAGPNESLGLNKRTSSQLSLDQMNGHLNRRRSSSELSIGESPSLQSLEVIKTILNSRKNSLANSSGEEERDIEVNARRPSDELKFASLELKTCKTPKTMQQEGQEDSNRDNKQNPDKSVEEKPKELPKLYRYSGPPSINFSTWSERPKSQVAIKNEGDYIYGETQTNANNRKYRLSTPPVAPKPATIQRMGIPEKEYKVPILVKPLKDVIVDRQNAKQDSNKPQFNGDLKPTHQSQNFTFRPNLEVKLRTPTQLSQTNHPTSLPLPTQRPTVESVLRPQTQTIVNTSTLPRSNKQRFSTPSTPPKPQILRSSSITQKQETENVFNKPGPQLLRSSSIKQTPENETTSQAPFGQNTLRRTGLKEKILAQQEQEQQNAITKQTTTNLASSSIQQKLLPNGDLKLNNQKFNNSITSAKLHLNLKKTNTTLTNNPELKSPSSCFSAKLPPTPHNTPLITTVNNFSLKATTTNPPPPPPPQTSTMSIQLKPSTPNLSPLRTEEPRDELLAAIRNFNKEGLKKA